MAFAKGRAMKGSRWWLASALILVLAVALSADGLRYWQGELYDLGQVVPRVGQQRLEAAESLPEGTRLPSLRSSRPAFFLIQLGEKDDEPFAAVADVSDRLQADDAVYVDVDRDRDLAEESAVRGRRWDEYDNFGPISVRLKRDGFVGLYHFYLCRASRNVRTADGGIGLRDVWSLRPACCNVGEITIASASYRAATADTHTNGRFNDICWASAGQGDVLYVDWNGDSKFSEDEQVMCGERYYRDGRWYRLAVSSDGTAVTFSPGDFEFGTLVTGHEKLGLRPLRFWVQITSRSNTGAVQVEATGDRVEVPADEYSLCRCWLEGSDDQGNTWRAEAGYGAPYPVFTVPAGQETTFEFGPPFTVALVANPSGPYRPGQTISFDTKVTGIDGKTYTFTRNGQRQPAPKMVIRDEAGKEIGTYAFQYG